ncbi:hypothetical protein CHELA1G11_21989 [Hyphomicrobiales bacterium]|nr:hypothetical protein CHELA1G2_20253 [Hyphomicrobiales bacterium]CAH1695728.1 hypothetical protein CHELA1G11_21989 [Hyphomicrobiales bacterium]
MMFAPLAKCRSSLGILTLSDSVRKSSLNSPCVPCRRDTALDILSNVPFAAAQLAVPTIDGSGHG